MANCASTIGFEGRELTCTRRKDHSGDHQGKIGPGLTHIWRDEVPDETPILTHPVQCSSRLLDDDEIFSCDLPRGHTASHRADIPGGSIMWGDEDAIRPETEIEATVDGDTLCLAHRRQSAIASARAYRG